MSIRVMTWVWDHAEAEGTDLLVLLAIADAADDDGTNAWPSIATLARKCRVSTRTVQRSIKTLEANEALRVHVQAGGSMKTRDDRRPNSYEIVVHNGVTDCHPADGDGMTSGAARGDTRVAHGVTLVSHEQSSDPSLDPPTSSALSASDAAPVDILCGYLADRIEQHRGGNRPTITAKWRRDMRLLVERGPLGVEAAKSIRPETVERCIEYVFTQLAEPEGRNGFCWADQIQSAGGLRQKWVQLREAARRKQNGAKGSGTRVIDDRTRAEGGTVESMSDILQMARSSGTPPQGKIIEAKAKEA